MTAGDIIQAALQASGISPSGEVPGPLHMSNCLDCLNRLLDQWNLGRPVYFPANEVSIPSSCCEAVVYNLAVDLMFRFGGCPPNALVEMALLTSAQVPNPSMPTVEECELIAVLVEARAELVARRAELELWAA